MLRVQRSLDHGRISGTKHLGSIRHSLKSLKHLAAPLRGGKLTSESEPSPIQNDSAVGTVAGVSNLSKSQLNEAKFKNCRTAAHFPLPTPFSSSLGFKKLRFCVGPYSSLSWGAGSPRATSWTRLAARSFGQQRLDLHCRPVNSFVNGMLINGPANDAVSQRRGRYSRHTLISLQSCSTGHTGSSHCWPLQCLIHNLWSVLQDHSRTKQKSINQNTNLPKRRS